MTSPVAFVLIGVLGAAPTPQDAEKDVRRAIHGFFAACRKQDARAAAAFWSEESPQYKSFGERASEVLFGPAKNVPQTVEAPRVVLEGDVAYAWVRFPGKWGEDKMYPDEKLTTWQVEFHRIAGEWKWWGQEPAVNDVARALLGAKDKERRAALLDGNAELINIRLITTLCEAATEYGLSGKTDEGLECVDVADQAVERLKNLTLHYTCRLSRGQVLLSAQRTKEAVDPLRAARDLADKSDDTGYQAEARAFLGLALVDAGRPDEGLKETTRAVELAGEVNHLVTLALAECFRATANRRLGRYAEALKWAEKSLSRSRGLAAGSMEVLALSEIGQIRMEQGNLAAALAPLLEGLERARKLEFLQFQGKILYSLGTVHIGVGEPEKALEYFETGLKIWDALGSDRMRGRVRSGMGSARVIVRDFDGAAEDLDLALEFLRKGGDLPGCAEAAGNRALLLMMQGETAGAVQQARESLTFLPPDDDDPLRLTIKMILGLALLEHRQWAEGLELLHAGLRASERMGMDLRVWVHAATGRALLRRSEAGDLESAVSSFQKAIAVLEETRRNLGENTVQQSYFSQLTPVHFCMTDALVRLKKPEDAFMASEQGKARTLIDLLDRPGNRLSKGMTPDERQEEESLEDQVGALVRRLGGTRVENERQQLKAQVDQARGAVEEFRRKVFLRHPSLKFERARFETATPAELQRSLFASAPDLAVLSYMVGPEEVLLFVLKPGAKAASVSVHRIPYPFNDLVTATSEFWAQCSSADGDYQPGARALYDALLKPAEAELQGVSQLVIVPDRMLHFLPFQALRDGSGRHLVEKWAVSFAPSVTALLRMRELGDRRRGDADKSLLPLLAVGAPVMPDAWHDLANAPREVKKVAELLGGTSLTGEDATESGVRERLPKARRIHIVTHGQVDEAMPMNSFVVLGRDDRHDGFLSARELADLDLKADLLVLSACETGIGQWRAGEGVVGLTWATAAAGVPASVLSQWRVDDARTADLMTSFYKALGGKRSKAESLREAQRELMKEEGRGHPFFWAPFVLMGDWRE